MAEMVKNVISVEQSNRFSAFCRKEIFQSADTLLSAPQSDRQQ
jgi:hypothetical protein